MHSHYNRKNVTRKKPRPGSRLTLLYLMNGKPVCQADYRLSADTRYVELPFPVARMLNT